ncbi:MAG: HD-GYP domain-containing protein [Planctomycetota bacterium]|jgi:HD-GYP domain-containing protein (c-di-GMP phosphodiesterase class II)
MLHTVKNSLSPSQLLDLERFADRIGKFGVNFAVYDREGEIVLLREGGTFKSSREQLVQWAREAQRQRHQDSRPDQAGASVWRFCDTNMGLAVVLEPAQLSSTGQKEILGTALIDLGRASRSIACSVAHGTGDARAVQMDSEYLAEMLELLAEKLQAYTKAEDQIDMVSTELAQTYEELVLLHKLSTNMKVTEADSNFLQMACDCLTEIVFVEGIAILLEKTIDDEQQWVIAAGSGLIDMDDQMAAILHGRLTEEINSGKEALLDSEIDSAFKYDWPSRIKNVIAVPFFGKDKTDSHLAGRTQNGNSIMGLMVAINRIGKQDFDSTDVKLFNSVAGGCAVFIENGRLFKDLKELFIGSLKALTSSIDAKDKYTHGHSERVAFISRWIAERLSEKEPLEEEQIHKIYLAGLLHDVGKIGIEEALLRKNGKLTEGEFDRVKKHPSIGAGILREIKQMRDIVSGVLCHHERVDGRGYPNGLQGEQIPLTGKILGLADSFDAMTSKRTYRDAMTVEQALAEIEKGLGTQFDEKLGRIFLESDVYRLWNIIRDGFSELYDNGNAEEYGAAAVGTLIR